MAHRPWDRLKNANPALQTISTGLSMVAAMGDVDQQSFAKFVATLVQTHIVHAHRRWEEMGLVAQTLRETGVEPLMTEVIESSHRRTVDAGIAPADGKIPSLDEALKILSEKVVRGR